MSLNATGTDARESKPASRSADRDGRKRASTQDRVEKTYVIRRNPARQKGYQPPPPPPPPPPPDDPPPPLPEEEPGAVAAEAIELERLEASEEPKLPTEPELQDRPEYQLGW